MGNIEKDYREAIALTTDFDSSLSPDLLSEACKYLPQNFNKNFFDEIDIRFEKSKDLNIDKNSTEEDIKITKNCKIDVFTKSGEYLFGAEKERDNITVKINDNSTLDVYRQDIQDAIAVGVICRQLQYEAGNRPFNKKTEFDKQSADEKREQIRNKVQTFLVEDAYIEFENEKGELIRSLNIGETEQALKKYNDIFYNKETELDNNKEIQSTGIALA